MFCIIYDETGAIDKITDTFKEALAYTDKERKEKSWKQFEIFCTNNPSYIYMNRDGYDYEAERLGLA